MFPIGPSGRLGLNPSTQVSVASSTASRVGQLRRPMTSVFYRPMIVSASALS